MIEKWRQLRLEVQVHPWLLRDSNSARVHEIISQNIKEMVKSNKNPKKEHANVAMVCGFSQALRELRREKKEWLFNFTYMVQTLLS